MSGCDYIIGPHPSDHTLQSLKLLYFCLQLIGYRGRARVMVSLVTDTDPPFPHAHSIVGKNTHDGRCIVEMGIETEMYAQ